MPGAANEKRRLLPEFLRERGWPAQTRLEDRLTVVDGRRLYSRSATGPDGGVPLVLIHGLVISSLYMIPLAEYLAARHEVHALDLPGFGRSEGPRRSLSIPELADAVVEWMVAEKMERCHLVANSLGCEVAAQVAVKAPARVLSLVLVGPTLDPGARAVITQTLRLLHDAWNEPFQLWMNWAFDFFRAGFRRALGTTRAMFRNHIEKDLPLISAPTLIVRGGLDPTVPQEAAETMAALLIRGELLVFEKAPHCVHYTQPVAVGKVIEAFTAAAGAP